METQRRQGKGNPISLKNVLEVWEGGGSDRLSVMF